MRRDPKIPVGGTYVYPICKRYCKSKRSISMHLRRAHDIRVCPTYEFNRTTHYCLDCFDTVSREGVRCTSCRQKGHRNHLYGKTLSASHIRKCRSATSRLWEDPEYRKKVIDGVSKPRSAEGKLNISKGVKQSYVNDPSLRKIRGEMFSQAWKDGRNPGSAIRSNRSKQEIELFNLVSSILPQASHNQTLRLNGKIFYPDILIPDVSLVVEYYGDYWHKNPIRGYDLQDREHDFDRITTMCDSGYSVVTIWEYDFLQSKDQCLQEILETYDKLINNTITMHYPDDYYLSWDSCVL